MNDGVEQARQTPGALLLDVRTPEEYAAGHVPGSRNIPLDCVGQAELDREAPLFVYCRSGARSGQACLCRRDRPGVLQALDRDRLPCRCLAAQAPLSGTRDIASTWIRRWRTGRTPLV